MIARVNLQWERESNFGLWKVQKNLTHSSAPICLKFGGHLEHHFFPRWQGLSCCVKAVLGVRGGGAKGLGAADSCCIPVHLIPCAAAAERNPVDTPFENCDSAAPATHLAQLSHPGTEAAMLRDQPKKVMPTYSGVKAAGERQRGFVSERSQILWSAVKCHPGLASLYAATH